MRQHQVGRSDASDSGAAQRGSGAAEINAAELTERVLRVAHLIRRSSMETMAHLHLTPAQSRALRVISKADEPIRMGELASTLGVVPRSATGLVDALEEAGLVERTTDQANRRAVLVTLTQQGRDMQEQLAEARRRAGDGIFGALDAQERRRLADLLTKLQPPV